MSSTIKRNFDQTRERTTSFSTLAPTRGRTNISSLTTKAGLLLVPVALSALIALSVMNDKLFFRELLLSAFIILAVMLCKASAAPRQ